MKKALFILTAFAGSSISATIFEAVPEVFKQMKTYPATTDINLELINKDSKPIWVTIKNGGDIYTIRGQNVFKLEGMSLFGGRQTRQFTGLDLSKDTQIATWHKDPGKVEIKKAFLGLIGPESFEPRPDRLTTFTKDRTLYLTNDNKGWRPQSGPLKAIKELVRKVKGEPTSTVLENKTDSGLSLANNVLPDDIKALPLK